MAFSFRDLFMRPMAMFSDWSSVLPSSQVLVSTRSPVRSLRSLGVSADVLLYAIHPAPSPRALS